jgi:diketogulonate reductase-like aldo/keto reductase
LKKIGGFEVNPIGIGTWQMESESDIGAIRYSLEREQNHIDTAEMYGLGRTEEIVGQAIKGFDRSKLFIASKIWRDHAQNESVIPAVKAMLGRLGTDYLDLLYIHHPWTDPVNYITGMNDAFEAGLVKQLGVSNFNVDQLKQVIRLSKHPITAIQNRLNLEYPGSIPMDLKLFCHDNDIAIVAHSPLQGGLHRGKDIARHHNASEAQVVLAWMVQEDLLPIPKASDRRHIDENLVALELKLSDEELAELSLV